MPRLSRRSIIVLAGVVLAGVVLASGALSPSKIDLAATTVSVTRGLFQVTHVEAGELRAARDEKIVAPRVHGQLKIVHLYPEGARVEVGDLILQFDREQHAQEVKDNAGKLEQAKADRFGHRKGRFALDQHLHPCGNRKAVGLYDVHDRPIAIQQGRRRCHDL